MKSNLTHGLTLAPQERMEAVLRTIRALTQADGTQPSNPEVAQRLGIPESTVRNYRNKLEENNRLPRAGKVKGTDGKAQTARKSRTPIKAPADSISEEQHAGMQAKAPVSRRRDARPPSIAEDHSGKITIVNEVDPDEDFGIKQLQNAGDDPMAEYVGPLKKALELISTISETGWSELVKGAPGGAIHNL